MLLGEGAFVCAHIIDAHGGPLFQGALGRLPKDLPLDHVIDSAMKYSPLPNPTLVAPGSRASAMHRNSHQHQHKGHAPVPCLSVCFFAGNNRYVLQDSLPRPGYKHVGGALSAGGDIDQLNTTLAKAEAHCKRQPNCAAFTYEGVANAKGVLRVYFKSGTTTNADGNWSSYLKNTGWVAGHLLSEGGTQMVQSLTQWAEDRPTADRKAVAKAVLSHLVYIAAYISPDTVQSWAATRWPSVNTLLEYALDRTLPEFGADPDVAPLGAANTTAILLSAAHHMGRVGFDWAAYYGGKANPRTANKTFPNGSVQIWNVYDHGVNNAEGALRWPATLYRLNASMKDGLGALKLLESKMDEYQAQGAS